VLIGGYPYSSIVSVGHSRLIGPAPATLSGESFALENHEAQSKLEEREHSAKIRLVCQGECRGPVGKTTAQVVTLFRMEQFDRLLAGASRSRKVFLLEVSNGHGSCEVVCGFGFNPDRRSYD